MFDFLITKRFKEKCKVIKIQKWSTLHIFTPSTVIPVLVFASPKNMSALHGQNVTFTCSAIGTSRPMFSWRKVQGSLPEFKTVVNDGKLTISNVTTADAGSYVCNASKSANNATVQLTLLPVMVSASPKNMSIQRGPHVTFTCNATGTLNPVFSWTKLQGNIPASRIVVKDGKLTIQNVTVADSGDYVCRVINSINTVSVQLRVFCTLISLTESNSSAILYVGQALSLSCAVSGGETLSWLYNGTNTLPSGAFIEKPGLVLVPSLFKNHTGVISCIAGNSLLWNLTIHVKYPETCTVQQQHICDVSSDYVIDPDDEQGVAPFPVYCNMTDKGGVGVTVVKHDSESKIIVHGYERQGGYSRDVHYLAANLSQIKQLIDISQECEQFIKFDCHHVRIFDTGQIFGWWMSRDGNKMTYWDGANEAHQGCACSVTKSCAMRSKLCNCDKNDSEWREDSGLLTNKTHLPVTQLRFGDTGSNHEKGFHTLGSFKCYGMK